MIVTEGFEPLENSLLEPLGPKVHFLELRQSYDGILLDVLTIKDQVQKIWRIDLSEVQNHMVIPRSPLRAARFDRCFYVRQGGPYIDYTVKIARPLHDHLATRFMHYRIVTESHFIDFVDVEEAEISLNSLSADDSD